MTTFLRASLLSLLTLFAVACQRASCASLEARVCADLGADCAAWREQGSSPIPTEAARMEPEGRGRNRLGDRLFIAVMDENSSSNSMCGNMAHEANYQSWTLVAARSVLGGPRVESPLDLSHDPNVIVAGYIQYFPFVFLPLMMLYSAYALRKARSAGSGSQPPGQQ